MGRKNNNAYDSSRRETRDYLHVMRDMMNSGIDESQAEEMARKATKKERRKRKKWK